MKEKDLLEKVLEEYNDVYADILNGFLFKGEPVVSPEDLEDAQPFTLYRDGESVREQYRDMAKFWRYPEGETVGKPEGEAEGEPEFYLERIPAGISEEILEEVPGRKTEGTPVSIRTVMFGIENQTAYDKDMPIRVMSYDAAEYRKQLDGKDRYPVITLILYYGERAWKNRRLQDIIPVPERLKPFASDYRINVYDLSRLTDEQIGCFKSDFGIIADYLKKSREDPDYVPEKAVEYRHPSETLDLLAHFTGDERYRKAWQEGREEIKDMISTVDYLMEKGRKEGIETGRKEGIKAGRREGIETGRREGNEKTLIQSIKALMETLHLSKEQAMEALKIPKEKRGYYSEKIS